MHIVQNPTQHHKFILMQLWHNIDTHITPSSLVKTPDKNLYSKSYDHKRHEQLSMHCDRTTMERFIYCIVKVASSESNSTPKLQLLKVYRNPNDLILSLTDSL